MKRLFASVRAATANLPISLPRKKLAGPGNRNRNLERVTVSSGHSSNKFNPRAMSGTASVQFTGVDAWSGPVHGTAHIAAQNKREKGAENDREYWDAILDQGKVHTHTCMGYVYAQGMWVCSH